MFACVLCASEVEVFIERCASHPNFTSFDQCSIIGTKT